MVSDQGGRSEEIYCPLNSFDLSGGKDLQGETFTLEPYYMVQITIFGVQAHLKTFTMLELHLK